MSAPRWERPVQRRLAQACAGVRKVLSAPKVCSTACACRAFAASASRSVYACRAFAASASRSIFICRSLRMSSLMSAMVPRPKQARRPAHPAVWAASCGVAPLWRLRRAYLGSLTMTPVTKSVNHAYCGGVAEVGACAP
jgi:hypothetical protein